MKEKYQKTLQELEKDIPVLQLLVTKPFEKDAELVQFKADVSKLEREISIKIQKNQLGQENGLTNNNENERNSSLVKMEKSLLPKKEITNKKTKRVRV